MPLATQPSAASRVYARSFFDLAMSQGGRNSVEDLMGELEEVVELTRSNLRFAEFLSHPGITSEQRKKSLTRIFQGRVSELTYRFLLVLNEKGRISALPAVVASMDELAQQAFGRVEVDVFTAQPVAGGDLASLRSRLSQSLGKDVIVHPYTDASMLGGVKIKLGDQLVDASLATRLRKMKDQVSRSGGSTLRSRIGRMLGD
jgi:F-type H+-transporting ATPase subunit delta